MQIQKNYVLGLALAFSLVACGKEEKTKTVTVENPKTVELLKQAQEERDALKAQIEEGGDLSQKVKDLEGKLATADAAANDLKAQIDQKNQRIEALEAEVRAGGNAEELNKQITALKNEKDDLEKKLKAASEDVIKLKAELGIASEAQKNFDKLLNFVFEYNAENKDDANDIKKIDDIRLALDTALGAVKNEIDALEKARPGLTTAVTDKFTLVTNAKKALKAVETEAGMESTYKTLSEIPEDKRTDAQQATYKLLHAYYEAVKALEIQEELHGKIEKAIEGLNGVIEDLKTAIRTDEAKLLDVNKALHALAWDEESEERDAAAAELVAERESLETAITKSKSKLAEETTKLEGKKEELNSSNEKLNGTETEKGLHQAVRDAEDNYNNADVKAANEVLTNAKNDFDDAKRKLSDNNTSAGKANEKKAGLESLIRFFESQYKKEEKK